MYTNISWYKPVFMYYLKKSGANDDFSYGFYLQCLFSEILKKD